MSACVLRLRLPVPVHVRRGACMRVQECVRCLQVFCGILARIAQFADIIRDSKEQIAKVRVLYPAPRRPPVA
jgi:hypothetical protein